MKRALLSAAPLLAAALAAAALTVPAAPARAQGLSYVTSFGSFGSGAGQFNGPSGVAVDGSGNVFVADRGNNRIVQLATVTVPEASPLALVAAGGLAMLIPWRIRRGAKRAA
jgi:hypothetical protein